MGSFDFTDESSGSDSDSTVHSKERIKSPSNSAQSKSGSCSPTRSMGSISNINSRNSRSPSINRGSRSRTRSNSRSSSSARSDASDQVENVNNINRSSRESSNSPNMSRKSSKSPIEKQLSTERNSPSPDSDCRKSVTPHRSRSSSQSSITASPRHRSHSRSRSQQKSHSRSHSRSVSPHNRSSKSPSSLKPKQSNNFQENGHESDDESVSGKRKRAIISDDEMDLKSSPNKSPTQKPIEDLENESPNKSIQSDDENNLFGDADDISDEEKKENENEVQEEQPDEETLVESRIEAEIPKIKTNLGREIHFVKLPNFLSVETRPFDPELYEDEVDEEETLDEEGRARLKLKVENTIRWRHNFDKDGNAIKESNTKLVRWSDGSMSLHLGEEIFDVYKQPLHGDHNHLFIRQGTGLQGQAVFRTKLSFRPHSTDSFTHRKMTLSLADRSTKTTGVKVLSNVTTKDPDSQRNESFKLDEEKFKATLRRQSKQKRIQEKGHRKLTKSYLEPEDEDGSISISAIKNKYKNKTDRSQIYSSDESESDASSDIEMRKRPKRETKRTAIAESDEESGAESMKSDAESEKSHKSDSSKMSQSDASGKKSDSEKSNASDSGSE